MDPQTQIPSPQPSEKLIYGGAWSRFWAYFIDSVLSGFFIFLFFDYLIFIKGEIISLDEFSAKYYWLGLIYIAVFLLYMIYFTFAWGTTIGKDLYGLKVVDYSNHDKLSLTKASLREAFRNLSVLIPVIGGIIYLANGLTIIFSKEKRGIHDRIAKTQVLKTKNAWPILKQLPLFLLILALIMPAAAAEIIVSSNKPPQQKNLQQATVPLRTGNENELQTFNSPKYKYSISYPESMTTLKGKDIDAADKEKSISLADYSSPDCCWIVIEILDQPWSQVETSPPWIGSTTMASLAGASGIEGDQVSKKDPPLKVAKYIYLQHPTLPGAVVSIRVEGNNEEILNSILKTLKFN
jgi:uncharacterized RDD family membrane protein YckC